MSNSWISWTNMSLQDAAAQYHRNMGGAAGGAGSEHQLVFIHFQGA